jgi:hypothetical protein
LNKNKIKKFENIKKNIVEKKEKNIKIKQFENK